jgi:hypothetical protein
VLNRLQLDSADIPSVVFHPWRSVDVAGAGIGKSLQLFSDQFEQYSQSRTLTDERDALDAVRGILAGYLKTARSSVRNE